MNQMLKLLINNRQRGRFEIVAKAQADEATIYLYDMIVEDDTTAEWWGGVSPQAFIKALNELTAKTIHLRVNSPGGSVFAARAIEQAIREHNSTIIAHVDGIAASAASFLIMAADEIVMSPGSFLMIHKAWTMTYGNADDLRKQSDLLDQIDVSLVKTYAKRSGQSEQDIMSMLAEETWLEATDAVEKGFANRVAEDEKTTSNAATSTAANSAWDLSAYQHAPSAVVPITPAQQSPAPAAEPEPAAEPAPLNVNRAALHRAALRALIPA